MTIMSKENELQLLRAITGCYRFLEEAEKEIDRFQREIERLRKEIDDALRETE